METKRTFAIFFDDFTKTAQKRIIAEELGRVTGDDGVNHITVKTDEDLYGYDPNPDNQMLEQHLHVNARHNGHDHEWLMVWDCMEAEFSTLMEYNQK
jgi:hypothetical protein